MALYELDGTAPSLAEGSWVADSAEVVGQVHLAEDTSVWFGAVVRGDQPEPITIGARSNIQDGSVLHADAGVPLHIGADVTVGHNVILHGCTVGDGCLIGMGAVVLNGAVIGKGCLVGAGALVTEGQQIPDGSLVVGAPAVVKRQLSPEQQARLALSAAHYVHNARRYAKGLRRIG